MIMRPYGTLRNLLLYRSTNDVDILPHVLGTANCLYLCLIRIVWKYRRGNQNP